MKTHETPRRRISAIMLSCALALQANAQITVNDMDEDPGLSAQDLAEALAGTGVSIVANSAQLVQNADPWSTPTDPPLSAAGTFTVTNDVLGAGFSSGVILSSGRADNIQGTEDALAIEGNYNLLSDAQAELGLMGDSQLEALYPEWYFQDGTSLEFDFVPDANQVSIQFVFASEEYTEYVNDGFNDIFAIFVNGQTVNLATVEPNDDPVSIDSINHLRNPLLFRNNDIHDSPEPLNGYHVTEADGFTTIITCILPVDANETNSLKVVIADAGDAILDSWALLKGASLTTLKPLIVTKEAEYPQALVEYEYMNYSIHLTNTGSSAATVSEIHDLLPLGFQYQSMSTTGFTEDEPVSTFEVINGITREYLVWEGPYTIPANTTVTLGFPAHVGYQLGTFYNGATALANVPVIPSGDTAPVEVIPALDLALIGPDGVEIPNGGTYDFGRFYTDGYPYSVPFTFTIKNRGAYDIEDIVLTDGDYDTPYNVQTDVSETSTTIGYGQSTTFKLRFIPSFPGQVMEGTILIESNDPDESPFTLHVIGEAIDDPYTVHKSYLKAPNTDAGDSFGNRIAFSGDTLVVGAPCEASNAAGVNGNQADNSSSLAGAVYVYRLNPATHTWALEAYLKASNSAGGDLFGCAVAIDGNTLVVGAANEDSSSAGINGSQSNNSASDSGAAYVFVRNGSTWTQQAYLKASNTEAGDLFGTSVAVHGATVIVGAPGEDSGATGVNGNQSDNSCSLSGAAYVFIRPGSTWSQQAYLKASSAVAGASLGRSAAICYHTVALGAPDANSAAGFVSVFTRSGSAWSHSGHVTAFNAGAGDCFGWSVALSQSALPDLIVGAPYEDSSGTGVGSAGTNNSNTNSGAAYVLKRSGGSWILEAFLKGSSSTISPNLFGWSVAATSRLVLVGAPHESSSSTGVGGYDADTSASHAGAAFLFLNNYNGCVYEDYLKASNTDASDIFGTSVAIEGDVAIAGAPGEASASTLAAPDEWDNSANDAGAIYYFDVAD